MSESKPYHLRRMERTIDSRQELLEVINSQLILTMAMCRDNEPYMVTLDYAFNETENCFYLHCAPVGKKLDFLRANPRVHGQVMEDRGYIKNYCEHAYRTVMFEGVVEFIEDTSEMLAALAFMVDRFEPGNDALKAKLVTQTHMARLKMLKLQVTSMTGKQSPTPAKK